LTQIFARVARRLLEEARSPSVCVGRVHTNANSFRYVRSKAARRSTDLVDAA
jgi:hypothetical protein